MKILFATNNQAKIERYAKELEKKGFEVLTLKDIVEKVEIKEDGNDAIENAIEKAKKYYNATKITTIGIDDSLYIDGLDKTKQPGTHIRRVNGKRLDDKEMIEYYISLVNELGGKTTGHYLHGFAICKNDEIFTFETKTYVTFVNTVSEIIKEGYPLDSICIDSVYNKYQSELTNQEREYKKEVKYNKIFEFLINNLK